MLNGILSAGLRRVNAVADFPSEAIRAIRGDATLPLFEAFPKLADRVPWHPIGRFPTPVVEIASPNPAARLWVKRDDLTCPRYGGNKVRKLEFLLAEARLATRRTLITLGGVGSNHALATAIHGRALGMEVDLLLYDQPSNFFVERNLGGFLAAGARVHYAGTTARAFLKARRLFEQRRREGAAPYFIMVGGTSSLGALGYVNAALELTRQIETGELPEPDVVFVALGTTGTAAGLLAGLRIAGLRSRVTAVRVADPVAANATVLRYFANETGTYLRSLDPSIPELRIGNDDFDVLSTQYGRGYGHTTDEARTMIRVYGDRLPLETTYTAKTLAGCIELCRAADRPMNILFWNTINSASIPAPASWADLPAELRSYVDHTARHPGDDTR